MRQGGGPLDFQVPAGVASCWTEGVIALHSRHAASRADHVPYQPRYLREDGIAIILSARWGRDSITMHIWTDIIAREFLMLATLTALGVGPASLLSRRFDPAARLALAPVLGLCVGTAVFTTLIWFTAASHTYWLPPILALASVAVAWRRKLGLDAVGAGMSGGAHGVEREGAPWRLPLVRLRPFDALALAVVCVVVAAPLSWTLHERHSVGPIGFEVWDTVGYTSEIDGMGLESIRQAAHGYAMQLAHTAPVASAATNPATTPRASFVQRYWEFYAFGDQNLDAAPLSANLNELAGLHATDTQALFLIVFLVTGALGAFAAVRYAAPRPLWVAPLGGLLFAGPFFMQLIADGSQAAVCGLAVILPLAAVSADVLRERRVATLVLCALLFSGLMALYPLFVSGAVLAAAVVLVVLGALRWRRGRLTRGTLVAAGASLALVLALSAVFDLVSFTRDLGYWHAVLSGGYYAGLPQYHLPFAVVPGWLLQTREFYFLTELGGAPFDQLVLAVALPALLLATIVFGVVRRRAGLVLVPVAVAFLLLAEYTSAAHGCSYCTDRALLPVAPVGIGLLALGVAALASAGKPWLRWAGVAVAVLALVAVGERARQERLRFADGGYFLDAGDRALISHVPPGSGAVDLEGYSEVLGKAPGELPLVYDAVWEHDDGEVSVPSNYVDNAGLAYLGEANPANPQFLPDYRYVLTRFGGVQTDRRVIARTGSLALEERDGPLDATAVSGLGLPLVRLAYEGFPWVEGPLHMIVTGGARGGDPRPVWIEARFSHAVPVSVPAQPGVRARLLPDHVLAACVQARGAPPLRRGTIALAFSPLPGAIPAEPFALPEPPQGVQLTALRAVSRCVLPR
jgi:hypothetical protein